MVEMVVIRRFLSESSLDSMEVVDVSFSSAEERSMSMGAFGDEVAEGDDEGASCSAASSSCSSSSSSASMEDVEEDCDCVSTASTSAKTISDSSWIGEWLRRWRLDGMTDGVWKASVCILCSVLGSSGVDCDMAGVLYNVMGVALALVWTVAGVSGTSPSISRMSCCSAA